MLTMCIFLFISRLNFGIDWISCLRILVGHFTIAGIVSAFFLSLFLCLCLFVLIANTQWLFTQIHTPIVAYAPNMDTWNPNEIVFASLLPIFVNALFSLLRVACVLRPCGVFCPFFMNTNGFCVCVCVVQSRCRISSMQRFSFHLPSSTRIFSELSFRPGQVFRFVVRACAF